jgi:sugar phosphate isomerase/epimerase
MTRRDFSSTMLAAAVPKWEIHGVVLGGQSYSFRHLPFDEMLAAWKKLGVTSIELCKTDIEPKRQQGESAAAYRQRLREWRLNVPMDVFRQVRRKMDGLGLNLYVYMYDFRDDFTEPEIARGFEMARALGVKVLNATSTLSVVKRIDAHAKVAKVRVGLHNHTWLTRPNEVTTPANCEEAMSGCSEYIGINLDVGHFLASGFDPVGFIERHHDRITTLHLKDRRKNDGPDMPFGQGDTPLREILQLMKRKRYRFPGMIEYENQGTDTFEQVAHALDYCAKALLEPLGAAPQK